MNTVVSGGQYNSLGQVSAFSESRSYVQSDTVYSISVSQATYDSLGKVVSFNASVSVSSASAPAVVSPVFSPDGGVQWSGSVNVTVSCATDGATIRYTTNGADPTESSPAVASGSSVFVPVPGTLKARAFKSGMTPSAVKIANYTAATVTSTHYVSPTGSNVAPFTNEATAARAIQDAVDEAPDGGEVIILPGTYALTNQVEIRWKGVLIKGLSATNTVIDGQGLVRPFFLSHPRAVLKELTIRGGLAPPSAGASSYGGGVYIRDGGTVLDCIIEHSEATFGGGVYIYGSGNVQRSVIRSNTAATSGGGITIAYGGAVTGGDIHGNTAAVHGGGIYLFEGGQISGATISNNAARWGGGVRVFTNGWVEGSTILNNTAWEGGGGLMLAHGGRATGSTIYNNTAALFGGGFYGFQGGVIEASTIYSNTARWGGGVRLYAGPEFKGAPSVVSRCRIYGNRALTEGTESGGGGVQIAMGGQVDNSLIYDNRALPYGGGVYLYEGGSIVNCTIADNVASNGWGGGLYTHAGGSLTNSIIFWNSAKTGENHFNWLSGARYTNCLTEPSIPGHAIITEPPAFENRRARDYRLRHISPAIDRGVDMEGVDFAGLPRRIDGNLDGFARTDIGAHEYVPMVTNLQVSVDYSGRVDNAWVATVLPHPWLVTNHSYRILVSHGDTVLRSHRMNPSLGSVTTVPDVPFEVPLSIRAFYDLNDDGFAQVWEPYGVYTNNPVVLVEGEPLPTINISLEDPIGDADGDGLTDFDEVFVYGTDPFVWDTDGDSFSDGEEVFLYGTDPRNPNSHPTNLMGAVFYDGVFGAGSPVHIEATYNRYDGGLVTKRIVTDLGPFVISNVPTLTPIQIAAFRDLNQDGQQEAWEPFASVTVSNQFADVDLSLQDPDTNATGIADLLKMTWSDYRDGSITFEEWQAGKGNPENYNPYHPQTNPSGTDLDIDAPGGDTDRDGMPDWWEIHFGLNPLDPSDAATDPAGSGMSNLQRYGYSLDRLGVGFDPDAGLDPRIADTDGDGMPDGWEVHFGLDPLDPSDADDDPDDDGLTSLEEYQYSLNRMGAGFDPSAGLHPRNFDTDGDGLPDGLEIQFGRDPLDDADKDSDLDGDGIPDLLEVTWSCYASGAITRGEWLAGLGNARHYDPYHPTDSPTGTDLDVLRADTDMDGMPDGWEVRYYPTLNPLEPRDGGLTFREWLDDDGILRTNDPDEDGLTNIEEYLFSVWYEGDGEFALQGLDPTNPDTDGDGVPDGLEIEWGTDPLDPDSFPVTLKGTIANETARPQTGHVFVAVSKVTTGEPVATFKAGAVFDDGLLAFDTGVFDPVLYVPNATEYLITAFLDANRNGEHDTWEPYGAANDGDPVLPDVADYELGTIVLRDALTDTSGDGIPDALKATWSDVIEGLISRAEWEAWMGDVSRHDPYHPTDNPTGSDLNHRVADSDGDGFDDWDEIYTHGTDPLDPASFPVRVSGVATNVSAFSGTVYVVLGAVSGDGVALTNNLGAMAPGDAASFVSDFVPNATDYTLRAFIDINGNATHETWEPYGDALDGTALRPMTNVNVGVVSIDASRIDSDGDGWTDYDELFVYGTDPHDDTSFPVPIVGIVENHTARPQSGEVFVAVRQAPGGAPLSVFSIGVMTNRSLIGFSTAEFDPPIYLANQTEYWATAFMDVNGDGIRNSWEPFGEMYDGDSEIPVNLFDAGTLLLNDSTTDSSQDGISDFLKVTWSDYAAGLISRVQWEAGLGDAGHVDPHHPVDHPSGTDLNPDLTDTDGDGFSDYDEIYVHGTDPLDAASFPAVIAGVISDAGSLTGPIHVTAVDADDPTIRAQVTLAAPGPYTLPLLRTRRTYLVSAYRDVNDNAQRDRWEPQAVHAGGPVLLTGNLTANMALQLLDADGDGFTDYAEIFEHGTDPDDAASFPAALSGTVAYAGVLSGTIRVTAVDTAAPTNIFTVTLGAPGAFALPLLPTLRAYTLSAYRDVDGNGVMERWDPRGAYAGGGAVNVTGNMTGLNIAMTDPDADGDGFTDYAEIFEHGTDPDDAASFPAALSGTVAYAGALTGTIRVTAVDTAAPTNIFTVTLGAPGAFALPLLPTLRAYTLSAYRDVDGNGVMERWDPRGAYAGGAAVNVTGNLTGLDIALTDPDADGDGFTDYAEIFEHGTDPDDAASFPVTFSGSVTNTTARPQSGNVYVQLSRAPEGVDPVLTLRIGTLAGAGALAFDTATLDPPLYVPNQSQYWARVYMDVNADGVFNTWEPGGQAFAGNSITPLANFTVGTVALTDSTADSSGDGMTDLLKVTWSDYAGGLITRAQWEAGMGDAGQVNPYHPVTNPTGTDLNPAVTDSDGDGFSDQDEIYVYGTDPIDPTSFPAFIGGAIGYDGSQTGTVMVVVSGGNMTNVLNLGAYTPGMLYRTPTNLPTQTSYTLRAFMDLNGNGSADLWEPVGELAGPIMLAGNVTDADIDLNDALHDTDGDGISDLLEATWSQFAAGTIAFAQWQGGEGDASLYDPYDPDTNPSGKDLNHLRPDTDGDGFEDGFEIEIGTDPLDPDSFPIRLSGTVTNATLQTGSVYVVTSRIPDGQYALTNAVGELDPGDAVLFETDYMPNATGYTVRAFMDLNLNGAHDAWEPYGDAADGNALTPATNLNVGLVTITMSQTDTDGDGWSDYDELFVHGTDPHDADSFPVTIGGTVSNATARPQTGAVFVVVGKVQDGTEAARFTVGAITNAGTLDFDTATLTPPIYVANQVSYWVAAFIDVTGNADMESWEPYGEALEGEPLTPTTNFLTGTIVVRDSTDDTSGDGMSDLLKATWSDYAAGLISRAQWEAGLGDASHYDPYHPDQNPGGTDLDIAAVDTDGDGLPDRWEIHFGLDPLDPDDAALDTDNDGLTNLAEYQYSLNRLGAGFNPADGLDPTQSDTDGDGLPDGWEIQYGLDPLDPDDAAGDLDGDGLSNLLEYQYGLDPTNADTDGDGLSDFLEVTWSSYASGAITFDQWLNGEGDPLSYDPFHPDDNPGGLDLDASEPDTDRNGFTDYEEVMNIGSDPLNEWDPIVVDDDDPFDPGPGNPIVKNPNANGRASWTAHTNHFPFDAIQDGIDVAQNGMTVLVLPGSYLGRGNREIDLQGKAITVKSWEGPDDTILQDNTRMAFRVASNETAATVIEGFTIRTWAQFSSHEGILCKASSPTIREVRFWDCAVGLRVTNNAAPVVENCVFDSNAAGIRIHDSNPTIRRSIFTGNRDRYTIENRGDYGAGLFMSGSSSPLISNCLIIHNEAKRQGGGVYIEAGAAPVFLNCTIAGNSAGISGGGIFSAGSTFIGNSIVYDNVAPTAPGLAVQGAAVEVNASCLQVFVPGFGNITNEPLFVSSSDFQLTSNSPAIDAGQSAFWYDAWNELIPAPADDLLGGARPVDGSGDGVARFDMGAYEFVPGMGGASEPPVSLIELAHGSEADAYVEGWKSAYGEDWFTMEGPAGAHGDLDGDGMTNYEEWLAGTDPLDPACNLRISGVRRVAADGMEASEDRLIGGRELVWRSVPGRTYMLETSVDLKHWEPVGEAITATADVTRMVHAVEAAPARFYRITLAP